MIPFFFRGGTEYLPRLTVFWGGLPGVAGPFVAHGFRREACLLA
jgi:hypothetical protein